MKILQTAPVDIAVSNKLKYAGTERIVYALNREYSTNKLKSLVAASGDSNLNGYGFLFVTIGNSLWLSSTNGYERITIESKESYKEHYKKCLEVALGEKVDIIHDHPGEYILNSDEYLEIRNHFQVPILTTIHEDVNDKVLSKFSVWKMLQKEKRNIRFVGISETHRKKFETKLGLEIPNFVYNGLEIDKFPFKLEKQEYMFWIGRLSDIKGTDIAVKVALKTGLPLIIAGEVHSPYKEKYNEVIRPFLTKSFENDPYEIQEAKRDELVSKLENNESIIDKGEIYFVGPLDDKQKSVFYQNAKLVLVPNRWEEPFGLISIEGMATGTPIIGTKRGALPEVIKHGETGYISEVYYNNGSLDENLLIESISDFVRNIDSISPHACRKRVKENFTSDIMADNYIKIYRDLLNR